MSKKRDAKAATASPAPGLELLTPPRFPILRRGGRGPLTSVMSLETLAALTKRDDATKEDILLPKKGLRFVPSTAEHQTGGPGNLLELRGKHFDFSPHAWRQFGRSMGFPSDYALKVNADERDRMVAYWKKQDPDTMLLFRVRDVPANGHLAQHTIRAVVPQDFSRFDNSFLVNSLGDILGPEHVLRSVDLTDESLSLMITDKQLYDCVGTEEAVLRLSKIGTTNDPVATGLHIASSEVGAGPFAVDLVVFRLVCTNGVMSWLPRAMFKKEKRWGDTLMFRDLLREAFREGSMLSERVVSRFKQSRLTTYRRGPQGHERILKAVFQHNGLTGRGNLDLVLARWDNFPAGDPPDARKDYTKFGLIDALTRVAQQLPDRREAMAWEQAAGKYLAAAN